jgi:hypothetical protein
MLPDRIIEDGSLRLADGRVSVSVRIPWYRSLPLSSVTNVQLTIDEKPVPVESIVWRTAAGESYGLDDLAPRHDQWWFVLDSAVIEGDAPAGLSPGDHDVAVQVGLYIPYLPAGDGVLAIAEKDRKTLKLEEAA